MNPLLVLWQGLARFGGWLIERPIRAVLLLLVLHVSVHQFVLDPRLRAVRDKALTERDAEIAAHQLTKKSYRLAQAESEARDRAHVARVEAEQREITDEVVADYTRRLADARAAAERLRADLARAGAHPAGASGGEPLPGPADAAGRVAEAAGDHGLPFTIEERLIATEQAIQLNALIDWVEAQSRAGAAARP